MFIESHKSTVGILLHKKFAPVWGVHLLYQTPYEVDRLPSIVMDTGIVTRDRSRVWVWRVQGRDRNFYPEVFPHPVVTGHRNILLNWAGVISYTVLIYIHKKGKEESKEWTSIASCLHIPIQISQLSKSVQQTRSFLMMTTCHRLLSDAARWRHQRLPLQLLPALQKIQIWNLRQSSHQQKIYLGLLPTKHLLKLLPTRMISPVIMRGGQPIRTLFSSQQTKRMRPILIPQQRRHQQKRTKLPNVSQTPVRMKFQKKS